MKIGSRNREVRKIAEKNTDVYPREMKIGSRNREVQKIAGKIRGISEGNENWFGKSGGSKNCR